MNKVVYWIIWGFAAISVNVFVIPFATVTTEDSLLPVLLIILLCNLITVQLFVAALREHTQRFIIGIVIASVLVLSLFFVFQKIMIQLAIILLIISLLAGAILFIVEVFSKAWQNN